MSHVGIEIVADRLANPTKGLPAMIAQIQTDFATANGITLPTSLTIYNDVDHPLECAMLAELPEHMTYPCVRVLTMTVDRQGAIPQPWPDGVYRTDGTLSVAVQLLLRKSDPDASGKYLLRAIYGVLLWLNADCPFGAEGVALSPSTSIRQAQIDAPLGDIAISPGSLLVAYPFLESVPLTGIYS